MIYIYIYIYIYICVCVCVCTLIFTQLHTLAEEATESKGGHFIN